MRTLQVLLDDYTSQWALARGHASDWKTPTVEITLSDAERLLSRPVSTS